MIHGTFKLNHIPRENFTKIISGSRCRYSVKIIARQIKAQYCNHTHYLTHGVKTIDPYFVGGIKPKSISEKKFLYAILIFDLSSIIPEMVFPRFGNQYVRFVMFRTKARGNFNYIIRNHLSRREREKGTESYIIGSASVRF